MKTRLTFNGAITLAVLMLSGCGILPIKAYTNTEADGLAKNSNSQASFELRDKRIKNAKDGSLIDCSNPKKHSDVLVLLALSGGGSRAALLSGLSMIELQKMQLENGSNVLSQVDLISSVSGGSLAAAYYVNSEDPVDSGSSENSDQAECRHAVSGRIWNEQKVTELMSKNYIGPWILNWFWPDNIFLYWLSTYDRTDMMAQTFADNLYDESLFGRDLKFSELNAARPNLIINATQGSINASENGRRSNGFGQPFTFTAEDFGRICSSLGDYDLSRGVMASSTFPGVFNFMTLRNYCKAGYVHLFDGGNSDNLGLTSIKREIWNLNDAGKLSNGKRLSDYKKIIVILVDAYTDSSGVPEAKNDPRSWYDYFVDTNFITATDALLAKNRDNLINQFEIKNIFPYSIKEVKAAAKTNEQDQEVKKREEDNVSSECKKFFTWQTPEVANTNCELNASNEKMWGSLNSEIKSKMKFIHIKFEDVVDPDLKHQLNNIATNFKLDSDENLVTTLTAKQAIICAVPTLFGRDKQCNRGGKPYTYSASNRTKEKWHLIQDAINHSLLK